MLLAGGQGSRLGALTKSIAKPAVSFGGKYRIIDFSLSNCANSKIDTVGVLTQYRPFRLNSYIANGQAWDLGGKDGGVYMLPPYATESGGEWYKGTADAIYQNLEFIEMYDAKYVLILSGDHLYRMDYQKMLQNHIQRGADLSVSVIQVDWDEASRFGIITADEDGRIKKFTEKPKEPDSNLASMGIYIFSMDVLKDALIEDSTDANSEHDFGNDIIPKLLAANKKLYCYEFSGFWKDVGTIPSYHETSMGLLDPNPAFDLFDPSLPPIMSNSNIYPPQYLGADAKVSKSMVANASCVLGTVNHSILSTECFVGEGAYVEDSVLLPGARVEAGAKVVRAILGEEAVVAENVEFGSSDPDVDIAVLGNRDTASLPGAKGGNVNG
jgi:glucose-1-phosphate adenylyltransferase